MKLELSIDSRPLHVELDDVIAGLLAARLGLPLDGDIAARSAATSATRPGRGRWMTTICASA